MTDIELTDFGLTEQHAQFAAAADVNARGEFEIVAITAGQANGWNFTAKALQESVKLWDGTNSLIDHAGFFDMPSIMKLGGVCYGPAWDESRQGIKATLRPFGPCGPLVADLGKEVLAAKAKGDPMPKIGFSADIWFKANGRDVIEITRITSLDLVIDPARGGDFLRALNQAGYPRREATMADTATPAPAPATAPAPAANTAQTPTPVAAQLEADLAAIRNMAQVDEERRALASEAAKARELRAAMCGHLLDTGLAASRLPTPMQDSVRKQFSTIGADGKIKPRAFEPTELTDAIDAARDLVSALTGPSAVIGPGRTHSMFNTDDKVLAAVEDLMEVPRDDALKAVKTAQLSGVRELYLMFTGDRDFRGGYYPEHVQLGTGSFTSIVANVMNKAVVTRWELMGRKGYDWWNQVAHVEKFKDLQQVRWLITGTIATLPTVAKGAEYTPLMIGVGHELSSFAKYGGYVGIDLEDLINDDTRKLRETPRELASAAIRNISELVAALFTMNSAVGPTLVDTGALFNNTAVATAGGHLNLLTTALGTTYAAWDAAATAVYNQPMLVSNDTGYIGTGKKLGLNPSICLVPRALQPAAEALFTPNWADRVEAIAASGGPTYAGHVKPLVVPEWTDATDWAAVCDKDLVPGVCIGHVFGLMPEIFVAGDELSPAVFANDEFRVKVRHHLAVGVADFRPLHKNNVAG
jgi:hypothetical protein